MLNIPYESLKTVNKLPDVFDRLGFIYAKVALLYSLGHEITKLDEDIVTEIKNGTDIVHVFEEWKNQPFSNEMSSQPILADTDVLVLKSMILGSLVSFETPNDQVSIGLAETLLGAMESLLSTSNELNAFPYREQLTIKITVSDRYDGLPRVVNHETGAFRVEVLHSLSFSVHTIDDRKSYSKWMLETILGFLSQILYIPDIESWAEKVIKRERGFFRSVTLGDSLSRDRNVFGDQYGKSLAEWWDEDDLKYDVLRDRQWYTPSQSDKCAAEPVKFGSGSPPEELYDLEKLKHSDRGLISPIDIQLWDKAEWIGTLFMVYLDYPPVLGVIYKNGEAGKAIFREWYDRWAGKDEHDYLRISVVRGISTRNPAEYAVVIGANIQRIYSNERKVVLGISRINKMKPDSTKNLKMFIEEYKKKGRFILVPVQMDMRKRSPEILSESLVIEKCELHVREAWQIGVNDPDVVALNEDDDPIIPEGMEDPPIAEVLENKRKNRRT